VEAKLHSDGGGVFVRTRDVNQFYTALNNVVSEGTVQIESISPADDDANAIYQYLIGSQGGSL